MNKLKFIINIIIITMFIITTIIIKNLIFSVHLKPSGRRNTNEIYSHTFSYEFLGQTLTSEHYSEHVLVSHLKQSFTFSYPFFSPSLQPDLQQVIGKPTVALTDEDKHRAQASAENKRKWKSMITFYSINSDSTLWWPVNPCLTSAVLSTVHRVSNQWHSRRASINNNKKWNNLLQSFYTWCTEESTWYCQQNREESSITGHVYFST